MENVFITHTTAFQIFRHLRNTYPHTIDLADTSLLPKNTMSAKLSTLNYSFLNYYDLTCDKIHISVANQNLTHKSKKLMIHKVCNNYPKNSYLKLQENIYISSPELTFCNMAEILPYEKLFLLGLEICGTYSIYQDDEKGFVNNILPITNPYKILRYIQAYKKMNHVKNIRLAEKVAKRLTPFSASPQESRIYIILVSSHAQGGFGIRGLHFNRKIELSENAKQQSGQSVIIPDFSNSKTKVAIEYDSSAYHDINAQNQRDKLRINALRHDGWKTFTFVKSHLSNPYAFKNLAEDILKANKQEKRIRTKNFEGKFLNLYNTLERSNNNMRG